jgi:two-component sensor histidine kinase
LRTATFAVAPEFTVGRKLNEIGNGQWDIPKLRTSLETIISGRKTIEERARLAREHAAAHERIGMLLQELTHRVKNSLQFIASMVRLEARSNNSVEAKAALEKVSHRITALGQLYSKLSKADSVEAVDAATYLDELCGDLIASVHKEGSTPIVLKTDIESELLPTDRAIPIGLM